MDLRDPILLVYPGMVQAPSYQPAMMPAPVPMMPAMGTVPTIPGEAGFRAPGEALGAEGGGRVLLGVQMAPGIKSEVWPRRLTCSGHPLFAAMMVPPQPQPLLSSLDSRQLAEQQQNFINQQAMILVTTMAGPWDCLGSVGTGGRASGGSYWLASPFPQAQQMTTQAMSLSLEQQNQRRQHGAQASAAASQAPPSVTAPKPQKPTAPQKTLESRPEPLDVCFRVRSRG